LLGSLVDGDESTPLVDPRDAAAPFAIESPRSNDVEKGASV
jgi:hypothetical protein